MRLRMITATAGASLLLFSGTATASSYPVEGAPKLTDNALYAGAKPAKVTCGRTLSKGMTAASAQKYLSRLVACMNTSWMPALRAAGFTVTPPSVAVGRVMPRCDGYSADRSVGSQVLSCRHVIRVQLASDWIS